VDEHVLDFWDDERADGLMCCVGGLKMGRGEAGWMVRGGEGSMVVKDVDCG
jgi:hypothetical protein